MLKKLFISFLACFTLIFSTVGGYAQATTGNPALDTVMRINKALFSTVATGVAASAAVGIKAKQIYDDNKQAVYDGAIKAYDTMSDSAKESWASAVARGRTGADMSKELWDKLTGVITDVFSSHTTSQSSIDTNSKGSYYGGSTINFNFGKKVYVHWYVKGYEDSPGHHTYQYITGMTVSGGSQVGMVFNGVTPVNDGEHSTDGFSPRFLDDFVFNVNDDVTISNIISAINIHTKYQITFGSTTNVIDPIYDTALKRALETDIPRMKDAGMVIPQAELTTPAGTRINLDANTGTMTLPDGTIWTGNVDDLKIGIPDAIINNGDAVWSDGRTDTNVWTGERTTTVTGEAVDTGQSALDRILEGIEDLPADLTTILTKLFIPTTIASSWADITTTLQSRLKLPSFGWLVTDGIVCTESGKDVRITFNGETTTFVDMSWLYSVRNFYMPVMRGFLWFLFGWYVYRKAIAITNKVDGIEK